MAIITASPSNFQKLIDLQKLSLEHLENINASISQSLVYESALNDIMSAIKSNIASISNTNITNNTTQSSTVVERNSNSSTSVVTQSEEQTKEKEARDNRIISVLEVIAKNTAPISIGTPKATTDSEGPGLGGIATAMAVALGALVATINSQVKAIAYFLDLLVPDKLTAAIAKSVASFVAGLSMELDLLKALVSEKMSGAVKVLDSIGDWIKGMFAATSESKVGSIISSFLSYIGKVLDPFVDVVKAIMGWLEGPTSKVWETIKGVFSTMGSYLDDFAKMIGKVAVVLEKFLLPLTIIMTVWDTVKGAIEGYEKEGIIGGIKGAITGFFNSLIFGPLDMIKNATAWVMGFFGFEDAKKTLESFSLEKLFKDFIDKLFSPVETFKAIMAKVTDFFKNMKQFQIPSFGFTIPESIPFIGGKAFKFGPWYPFGKPSDQNNDTTKGSESAAPTSPQTPSPEVDANGYMTGRTLFEYNKQQTLEKLNRESAMLSNGRSDADLISQRTNAVNSLREEPKGANVNTIVAPSVNNNIRNTQVASVRAPVRSQEPAFDRYQISSIVAP